MRPSTTTSPSWSSCNWKTSASAPKAKGTLRGRRQPDIRRGTAAFQYRRRRTVQQPSGQSGRHDQGDRGRAPAARRGASGRTGEELRPGLAAGPGGSMASAIRTPPSFSSGRIDRCISANRRAAGRPTYALHIRNRRRSGGGRNRHAAVAPVRPVRMLPLAPRAFCPFCKAPDPRWTASSGQGEIFSFSVARTATPYVVAYVRLAEGPLMLTNIVDCDPDGVRIGQRVSAPLPPDAARPAAAGVRPGARSRQGLETCIPEIASPVAVSCWPRGPGPGPRGRRPGGRVPAPCRDDRALPWPERPSTIVSVSWRPGSRSSGTSRSRGKPRGRRWADPGTVAARMAPPMATPSCTPARPFSSCRISTRRQTTTR